jgi:outer membrane receptor for ferrienterochelin and colicin
MKLGLYCLLLAMAQAQASDGPQTVVINGQTDLEASRDFVAGKLVISSKTLEQGGAQNVGDALRREPAITIGKNGQLGLLGLPGYTQVLVDGAAAVGDPYALDLAQVEHIEIIKSATAATGPFGIAGTINIIRRKAERKAMTQLRAGGSAVSGHGGANLSLMNNQVPTGTPLMYNFMLLASNKASPSGEQYRQLHSLGAAQPSTQLDGTRSGLSRTESISASSDISWTVDAAHKLSFSPAALRFTINAHGAEQRRWTDGSTLSLQRQNDDALTAIDLPLRWDWKIDSASRLSLKAKANRIQAPTSAQRLTGSSADGNHVSTQEHSRDVRNRFLDLDFNTSLDGGHEVAAGIKLARNDTDYRYDDRIDGQPDLGQAALGTSNRTEVERRQFFVQDEWRLTPALALNLGMSTEQRVQQLYEAGLQQRPRFSIWSPSAHLAYKIGGDNKRQLRASLARSFEAPDARQLLLHPALNPLALCYQRQLCGANTLDTADNAGNPGLQPERALGLNLSYTHGLGARSEAKVELYARRITQKIGTELALAQVAWASVPRYVLRPANLGDATLRGINLEGRLAVRDLWKSAPELDLNGSLGYARSEVKDVPGPDNRLDGQLPWRAKLGMTYSLSAVPLKLNLDASLLPGDWTRNNLTQRTYQSHRYTLNAGANWKLNATQRLVFSVDNLLARDGSSIGEYYGSGQTLRRYSNTDAYTSVSARLEMSL